MLSHPDQWKSALQLLPGEEAQFRMAPELRKKQPRSSRPVPGARDSAVLVLLMPHPSGWQTVLMERTVYNGVHSGQISFPGGKQEKADPDLAFTALRETEEEIGISRDTVTVLGALSPLYVPVSHANIYPFVGYVEGQPDFVPDPAEVAALFAVGLEDLFREEKKSEKDFPLSNGLSIRAPYYALEEKVVWGATAMILSELEEVFRRGI